jgi:endonuclease/exonuclease/phosphatase (EEP) superfamily protein YafD
VNYAVQLMITYLLVGLVLLFFKQPKLTFIFFGGCLLLSFYLKFSIKNNHIERWRNAMLRKYQPEEEVVELSAAQFNLTNSSTPEEMLNAFRASKSDLISIHEVTPGWSQWLEDSLSQNYPFHHTMEDIGMFGMSIFSRFPLNSVDTFYYDEIPCLRACLQKDGLDLCLISVHTEPALNDYSLRRLQGELETLTAQISRMDMPILVMGDFNAVSWSKELQHFMTSTGLLESRSGFMDRQGSWWDVPVDHIFHSPRLGCTDFDNLSDRMGNHLGIKASFSLIPLAKNVKKTAQ